MEANGDVVSWSYDNTYQLTHEQRSGANAYNVTYAYDSAGNRMKKVDSASRTTSSYDTANQLTRQLNPDGTIATYSFDASENQLRTVVAGVVTTNTWDFENRLTRIRQGGATPLINTMTYNGDGYRVRKDDSGGTTKPIWDGGNILQETNQNDITQVVYTQDPVLVTRLISQIRGSTTNFYCFDGLGSTNQLTDITGSIITDTFLFRAFGESQFSSVTTQNSFRF